MSDGYYLHVAIDDYCQTIRFCPEADLLASLYDADALNVAAMKGGFTKAFGRGTLRDNDATGTNVLKTIKDKLGNLASGDYLLITFNGYGVQPEDANGALNPANRGWLLHDGDFLLTDLFAELATAATGVRILVVSASCFSGTMNSQPNESSPRILEVTKKRASELFSQRQSVMDLGLSLRHTDPSIYHLTACALNETVPDGFVSSQIKQHSPFVQALLDLLGDANRRTFAGFLRDPHAKRP